MSSAIPVPRRGSPITAAWGAAVANAINSTAAFGGSGSLVRDGAGGQGFASLPQNHRDKKSESNDLFRVRYVEQDSTSGIPYTGFEICLPQGCVNVGTTCAPINVKATRTVSGSSVIQPNWYRMPYPSGTPDDGEEWDVTVHAKPSSGLVGIDTFTDWPKNYLFAEIHKHSRTQAQLTADQSDCGDNFSCTVGKVVWNEVDTDDGVEMIPTITRSVSTALAMTCTVNREFELLYGFEVDNTELTLEVKKLYLRNKAFTAAGASFVGNELSEIALNAQSVILIIKTDSVPYYGIIRDSVNGTAQNDLEPIYDPAASEVSVRLYRLDGHCHVLADERESTRNLQLYKVT